MMNVGAAGKEDAVRAKAELRGYFTELTADRRRSPGDDLISTLAAARDGAELPGRQRTGRTGGDGPAYPGRRPGRHEPASSATCAYYPAPQPGPELLKTVQAEPERLPRTIEELLRYIPFRKGVGIPRIATEDVELGGVAIKAGDVVHVSYLTANRERRQVRPPRRAGPRPAVHPAHDVRLGAHTTVWVRRSPPWNSKWPSPRCWPASRPCVSTRSPRTSGGTRRPSRRYPLALPVTW
ncbi:Biflaviolin synthase CYP158A2 OS=Streptomyces microflavus OX=1919 GN=cyp158a2 PE=3 SV=1 [Streptomyces microflavus]